MNGNLAENVWVMSPRGITGRDSHCYKLLKEIYGLKKAHLSWHKKLCGYIKYLRFSEFRSTTCVLLRKNNSGNSQFMLVYVDDLLVFAQTKFETNIIVEELKLLYELKI